MATQLEYDNLLTRIAKLREIVTRNAETKIAREPQFAELLSSQIDQMLAAVIASDHSAAPSDFGLSNLIGFGPKPAASATDAHVTYQVEVYDDTVTAERIGAMADLYYIYHHEKVGVFRAVDQLGKLFRDGAVRLASGDGALGLYRLSHKQPLRYSRADRLQAYARGFGYCGAPAPPGITPNRDFHPLLTHFIREVSLYFSDKRISDVIREAGATRSIGSIAAVRRAGAELATNLKFSSYGYIPVMRTELMGTIDECFGILRSPDVRRLFGADNAWDVVEEILSRYFNEHPNTSARQRMAITGRNIINWIGHAPTLQASRTEFEARLVDIGDQCEEWLTSAETLGVAAPRANTSARVVPYRPRAVSAQG
jgi:hypothetical protein